MLNREEMRRKLLTRLEQEKREFAMESMHFLERPLKARSAFKGRLSIALD